MSKSRYLGWFLLIVLLVGCSTSVTPPATLTPTPVVTIKLEDQKYCIATGDVLTTLSPGAIDQYFNRLGDLGIKCIRWDFDWNLTQHADDLIYDWAQTDFIVESARKHNLATLGLLSYAPNSVRDPSCNDKYNCLPTKADDFCSFAQAAASRYSDILHYWEIWNEPNIALGPDTDLSKALDVYAYMLKQCSTKIKQVNPSAFIVSGGLAPADDTQGYLAPVSYLVSLIKRDALRYVDAIGVHPYTYPVLPSYNAEWNSWQQMFLIRQLLDSSGYSHKQIWITEYGAPTGGPGDSHEAVQNGDFTFNYGADFMSEDAQKAMLSEAAALKSQNVSWLGPVFWYSFQDRSSSRDTTENFFGLLSYSGTKKPAYYLMKTLLAGG